MHAVVSLCKKPGLSCPKAGVIVPQNRGYRAPNFFCPCTISSIYNGFYQLHAFIRPNKIYKIDNAPARLTATGRLLEFLAFGILLNTKTSAERPYAELPPHR